MASAGTAEGARATLSAARFDLCVLDLHVAGAEALLAEVLGWRQPVVLTGPHADLLDRGAGRRPYMTTALAAWASRMSGSPRMPRMATMATAPPSASAMLVVVTARASSSAGFMYMWTMTRR